MVYLCGMYWKINNLEAWNPIAEHILHHRKYSILRVDGEMGAGKTTFIACLLGMMGSDDAISSPTYSLVNEYHTLQGKVYHFDLYRLKDYRELEELGFEEYLDDDALCVIEWGDSFPDAFEGRDFHTLCIEECDGERTVSFE